MSNKIILKKSSVTAKVPLAEDLDYGELALNYADGKIYYKNSSNVIESFNSGSSSTGGEGNVTFVDITATGNAQVDGDFTVTNAGANAFSVVKTPFFTAPLEHTFDNPNAYGTGAIDFFGCSVAVSGNYAIIGARSEDEVDNNDSGKAYVFDVITGALVHTLDNPSTFFTKGGDSFGYSAGISGNYAIVGAPFSAAFDDAGVLPYEQGLYSQDTLIQAQNIVLENYKAISYDTVDASTASLTEITYIQPDYTGLTEVVALDSSVGYEYFNVSPPWDVEFLGNTYTNSVYYGTNGYITFGDGAYDDYDIANNVYLPKILIFGLANYCNGLWQGTEGVAPNRVHRVVVKNLFDVYGQTSSPNFTQFYEIRFYENDSSRVDIYFQEVPQTDPLVRGSSGKAYVYDVTTGTLVHELNNPNAYDINEGDNFGWSVGISGNYAIVSAYTEDDATSGFNSGKVYIFDVTTGGLLHTLDNPDAYVSPDDLFGYSVAISGNYAVVGAYQEDYAGGNSSGKAYIFNAITGALVHTLDNPNAYSTSAADFFGYSVAISGNYVIVGAWSEDDAGGSASGKAYIFNATTGELLYTLDNPNAYGTSANDYFAWRVAISDNYAIVGAYREDDAGGTDSGVVYIFDVTNGALVHTLDNSNAYGTSASDQFGQSVAISGNYVIVGAYYEDDALGTASGKSYIYRINTDDATHATITGDLTVTGKMYGDGSELVGVNYYDLTNFTTDLATKTTDNLTEGTTNLYITDARVRGALTGGTGVTINNGVIAIRQDVSTRAAVEFDELNVTDAFSVEKTTVAPASYSLAQTLNNPNAYNTSFADYFGDSVAISGNYVIVSASQEDDANGTSSGKSYIFNVVTGTLVHTLNNPNAYGTGAYDNFGQSVAISGNYAVVGAWSEDDAGGSASGKAYVFDVTTGALVHTLNNPNAYGTSAGDSFGYSVAISGNYAIIGAREEDDAGGSSSGKAYVYDVTTGALVHTLDNPNAYSTSAGDLFGYSVAISGNYAVVGAYWEDDAGGSSSGKAYVYDVTTGAIVHTLDNPNAYGTSASDYFGWSVGISGNYAIVSAYTEDDAGGSSSGKAYVYDVTTGGLLHTLDNPNAYGTSAGDNFARNVAISDNYVIVGALNEDDAGGSSSGKAYIYDVVTGELLYTLDNPNAYSTSANDYFGYSVAISGNYVVVGAYWEDDAGGSASGKAYVFEITPRQFTTDVTVSGETQINGNLTVSGDIVGSGTVPAGTITMITNTATLPTGYLECDGSTISEASYPGLVGMVPDFQVYTPSASSVTLFNNNWSSDADIVNPAVTYIANTNVYLSTYPAPDWQGGLFKALEINFSSAVTVDSAALFADFMGEPPSIWELRELSSNTVVLTKNTPAYTQDNSSSVEQYSNPANFTNVSTVVTSASYALFIGINPGYATDGGFTKFILRARLANPGSLYLPTATSITSSSAVRPIIKT